MTIDLATINFIPGQGGGGVIKSLSVTSNGVYSVPAGVDGYNPVDVDVHPSESLQRTYTSNGSYNITGEFNGGVITVDVPAPQFVTETLNVSANGTYNPGEGIDGYSQVVVNVPQSVTGYTVRDVLEVGLDIVNLYDSSITKMRDYAITNNSNLQTVDLPACTSVGNYAFKNCNSLQTVDLPACTSVGNYAFENCNSLQTVDLPACTSVGNYAFSACNSLRSISLPVCSYVAYDVFWNCWSLKSISLPVCEYISAYAFEDCSNLKYVYVGSEISKVCNLKDTNVFDGCSRLMYIVVPESLVESYKAATNWTYFSDKIVSSIPESPYSLCSFSDGILTGDIPYIDDELYDELNINNADIISVSLPLCTTVKTNTFQSCYNLQTVDLPACTYVGNYAFDYCKSIQSINIPNCKVIDFAGLGNLNVLQSISIPLCESIGKYGMNNCYALTSISIPLCSYIGAQGFYGCSSLSVAYIGTGLDTVCVLDTTNVFGYCPVLTSIYVPTSLVESYKTATNWTYYSDKIFGI